MLDFEKLEIRTCFKFGIVYCKEDEEDEDNLFGASKIIIIIYFLYLYFCVIFVYLIWGVCVFKDCFFARNFFHILKNDYLPFKILKLFSSFLKLNGVLVMKIS